MVYALEIVGGEARQRVEVAIRGRLEPLRQSGAGGVASNATRHLGRRRARLRRRPLLARQLVEAGERLGLAIGVKALEVRHQSVWSEDPEPNELDLEGAAAIAKRAGAYLPRQE